MQRIRLTPRSDWRDQFDDLGFHFHSLDNVYWDETACYRFSATEIDWIEEVTAELHRMSLEAVGHVVDQQRFDVFGLPVWFADLATDSWHEQAPSLFGRFDIAFDGIHAPKLLEYNADTPTSLIEASIAQWNWQQQVFPDADQFNSLHEKLIDRWKVLRDATGNVPVSFACVKTSEEDLGNLEYLRDTAMQAGVNALFLPIEDIGWSEADATFMDLDNNPVRALFKLYPWEWIAREPFGPHFSRARIPVIEPPWKVLLSCKAMLALLWELFPGHPNLLPSFLHDRNLPTHYVRKPRYSREGANVEVHGPRGSYAQPGSYGAEGHVYQSFNPLPEFDRNYPVIGSWIIGDEPAGIGIREDSSPITTNSSRFVPHYFV